MSVPVSFTRQARMDVRTFATGHDREALVSAIAEALGAHPEIGVVLDEPEAYVRAHKTGHHRAYYEVIEGPPRRIRVYRVVPIAFSQPALEP